MECYLCFVDNVQPQSLELNHIVGISPTRLSLETTLQVQNNLSKINFSLEMQNKISIYCTNSKQYIMSQIFYSLRGEFGEFQADLHIIHPSSRHFINNMADDFGNTSKLLTSI